MKEIIHLADLRASVFVEPHAITGVVLISTAKFNGVEKYELIIRMEAEEGYRSFLATNLKSLIGTKEGLYYMTINDKPAVESKVYFENVKAVFEWMDRVKHLAFISFDEGAVTYLRGLLVAEVI